MNDCFLFSRRNLLAVAILVASSSGGLSSCQKKPHEAPSPVLAASPSEAMQRAFTAAGHEPALTQPFGDSARLRWEPTWRAAYDKTDPTGAVYTYVPLTPTLLTAGGQPRAGEFRMVGTQRFIIAKHVGSTYSFDLATYTVAQPAGKPAGAKRRTFAEAAAQPIAFAVFSGKMSLQGLTAEKHAIFSYQNGVVVKQQKQLATARSTGANATSAYECVTVYTCYWSAYCEHNGNPITYGAMTQGIEGCDEPGQEACGIDNWGYSWSSNGYSTNQACTYVDDPPTPDPNDPGNPGGGGDGTDGQPFDPGIFTFEPTTADPDFPSDCGSWQFRAVGPSGYMACGVTGIEIDLLSQFRNSDGSLGVALNLYKANLYFEMPPRYTPGEAATICAQIKDEVEELLEDLYRSQSPPEIAQTINSTFIREMAARVASYGGRITQTPRYPNTPVGPYSHTMLPNNGGCM